MDGKFRKVWEKIVVFMQLEPDVAGSRLRGQDGCGNESGTMASECYHSRSKPYLENSKMKQWLVALAFVTAVSVSYAVVAYAGCVGGVCR